MHVLAKYFVQISIILNYIQVPRGAKKIPGGSCPPTSCAYAYNQTTWQCIQSDNLATVQSFNCFQFQF